MFEAETIHVHPFELAGICIGMLMIGVVCGKFWIATQYLGLISEVVQATRPCECQCEHQEDDDDTTIDEFDVADDSDYVESVAENKKDA